MQVIITCLPRIKRLKEFTNEHIESFVNISVQHKRRLKLYARIRRNCKVPQKFGDMAGVICVALLGVADMTQPKK